jgi:hypothetical protein
MTLGPDEPGDRVRHHPQLGVLLEEDPSARVGRVHDPARRHQRRRNTGTRPRADPAGDEERVEASQLFDQALQVEISLKKISSLCGKNKLERLTLTTFFLARLIFHLV